MNDNEFGNYLYALRKNAGLRQDEVARHIGVTNKAVSKWENGRSKPKTELLCKLADIFGVTAEALQNRMINNASVHTSADEK